MVQLQYLADRYECADFMTQDPSRVLRRYKMPQDLEVAAFISAMLAFGRRELFLPKIDLLLDLADKEGGPFYWISSGVHKKTFPPLKVLPETSFYRFYSYQDIHLLLSRLEEILSEESSLGEYFRHKYQEAQSGLEKEVADSKKRSCSKKVTKGIHLSQLIGEAFSDCSIVPKGKNSANKRVHMFLRWMVRQNSPVDLGLWNWYRAADLLIPLDTHVIQQSVKLGLFPPSENTSKKNIFAATASNARKLTEILAQIWPEDPCKGDFALFGLGVDKSFQTSTDN